MVCGVKVVNGKIFVHYYKSILDIPKGEVSKRPEEVLDYIEYDLLKKPRPEKK